MTIEESRALRFAWQTAFELRTCPGDTILFSNQSDPHAAAHIRSCPFCRKRLAMRDDLNAWVEMAEQLPIRRPKEHATVPQVGQVFSISRKLAGWGARNRYYTPPQVLVLDIYGETARVAQIYFDEALSGPGDVPLGGGLGFAQPWNVYALRLDHLATLRGEPGPGAVEKVKDQGTVFSIKRDSILFFFRRLEREVGAFFSFRSLQTGMEQPLISLVRARGAEAVLCGSQPHVDVPEDVDNPLLTLALARLPAEEMSLAASSDPDVILMNVLTRKNGDPVLASAMAEMTGREWTSRGLLLSGRVVDHAVVGKLKAWWMVPDRCTIEAAEADILAPNQPFFRILFEGLDRNLDTEGRLLMLMVDD